MRVGAAMTLVVTVALLSAGCADSPPPVTAQKVLDVPGIEPVVNAVALSADGGIVAVGDMDGGLVVRDLPSGTCLLYTSPSPRDRQKSRMPSSA